MSLGLVLAFSFSLFGLFFLNLLFSLRESSLEPQDAAAMLVLHVGVVAFDKLNNGASGRAHGARNSAGSTGASRAGDARC